MTTINQSGQAQKRLEEARRHLDSVRRRLLRPSAAILERALMELTLAVRLLHEGEELLPTPAAKTSDQAERAAWDTAQLARRELLHVRALARQAANFYSDRLHLLAKQDFSLCYNASGLASGLAEPKQFDQNLVLHG